MTDTAYLRSARHLAARVFLDRVRPGDLIVDATLGTGQDCEQLCRLVGDEGRVYGFDVQIDALNRTRERLKTAGLLNRAELILSGHENMKDFVPQGIRLVAFNLGWLPGSDKTVTTQVETTLKAVQSALDLLAPGGLLVICIYPGHEEGKREADALLRFSSALSPKICTVLYQRFINGGPGAPSCLLVEKITS
ncbi:MAG: class I SAM-dependent methyltransferase [Bacillota bacterium]|nr:class I SAM-dependent methyltransferase [Bacillota bacterium]